MALTEFDLTGARVLITGAGRGIGKGIGLAMADGGADVGVTSLGEASAQLVAEEVRARGRAGFGWAADGTNAESMKALLPRVMADLGGVDVLINCLGDSIQGAVAAAPGATGHVMTPAEWHHVIDINLTQAYLACHMFGPQLLERGEGCVINISSFAALKGGPNMSAYAAAKTGLTRFTESLALEWAPYGVRVNGIAPGTFPDREAMTDADWERRNAQAATTVPLRRMGLTREVGLLAVYLASEAAAYVTGQTIAIDGGRTIL